MNVLFQKTDDEVFSYERKKPVFDIEEGDVILSRSNRIQVSFRSGNSIHDGKGFLASFQAGYFYGSLLMCMNQGFFLCLAAQHTIQFLVLVASFFSGWLPQWPNNCAPTKNKIKFFFSGTQRRIASRKIKVTVALFLSLA